MKEKKKSCVDCEKKNSKGNTFYFLFCLFDCELTDTSTINLAIWTIAMKRRVQAPLANFALEACLMVALVIRISRRQ